MTMNRPSDPMADLNRQIEQLGVDAPDAWRLGHDRNCNVRIAFPTGPDDCNCDGPLSEEEMEKILTGAEEAKARWDEENAPKPKPMRIRYMELPMEHDGDEVRTPFILIFDRMPDDHARQLFDQLDPDSRKTTDGKTLKESIGARAILFLTDEVQIGEDV